MFARSAAHFGRRLQPATEGRALGPAEYFAAQFSIELHARLTGGLTSFVSAFLCVRWLLRFISHHDFTAFAWYRIVFGLAVLGTYYTGVVNWSAS